RGRVLRNLLRRRIGLRGPVLRDQFFLVAASEPSAVFRCKRQHYDEKTDNDEACILLEPTHSGIHSLLIGAANAACGGRVPTQERDSLQILEQAWRRFSRNLLTD